MWMWRAVLASILLSLFVAFSTHAGRPSPEDRTYVSPAIDKIISGLKPLLKDPFLADLFENCLPNTLDTTVKYFDAVLPDSFVITGDIDALWLRDSSNQVIPYIPYVASDETLDVLLRGLIKRHAQSVLIDPFANAFQYNNATPSDHRSDQRIPPMQNAIFEGKYEIDSLGSFLKLSYWYWRYASVAGRAAAFDSQWVSAVTKAMQTIQQMQVETIFTDPPSYSFKRETTEALDTLIMDGRGPPGKVNGLTRSLFRPSDDASTHPYNIPGNAMACVELKHLQTVLSTLDASKAEVTNAEELAASVSSSLCEALSTLVSAAGSSKLAFEIDGYGSQYYMDDANLPSILSMPLTGLLSPTHPAYLASRKFILSGDNPYYFSGSAASGVGGPHVGYNMIWPMSLVAQAMTSTSDDEIEQCLEWLVSSSAGTGYMHESFDANDFGHYTRSWFAWANGLLGELVLHLVWSRPYLVLKDGDHVIAEAQSLTAPPISLVSQAETLFK